MVVVTAETIANKMKKYAIKGVKFISQGVRYV